MFPRGGLLHFRTRYVCTAPRAGLGAVPVPCGSHRTAISRVVWPVRAYWLRGATYQRALSTGGQRRISWRPPRRAAAPIPVCLPSLVPGTRLASPVRYLVRAVQPKCDPEAGERRSINFWSSSAYFCRCMGRSGAGALRQQQLGEPFGQHLDRHRRPDLAPRRPVLLGEHHGILAIGVAAAF